MERNLDSLLSIIIFFVTLLLVITRPLGLGIGWSAWIGAAACLFAGLVTVEDVVYVAGLVWDATLAFILLVFISIVLDRAGLFEWTALKAVGLARGRGFLLFVAIMLLGAFISAIFANDGAALMLTPIIYSKIKYLGLPKSSILPYIMGSGFIADTASLPLIISNLTNIITAQFFQIGFGEFAIYMFFPNLVSVFTSILVLYLTFRKDLIRRYDPEAFQSSQANLAIRDPFVFLTGWLLMPLLGVLLLGMELFQLKMPVSSILGAVALLLALSTLKNRVVSVKEVLRLTPWSVVLFSIGMYTVVYSLRLSGLIGLLSSLINWLNSLGEYYAIIGTGILSAFLSAIMNNLPTVMIMNLAIQEAGLGQSIENFLALSNVVGTNIGPKLTPIGSLATLLWLHVLENKGIRVGWLYYTKLGFLLTLPVLTTTLLSLCVVYFLSKG